MAFRLNLGFLTVKIGADTTDLNRADREIKRRSKSMGRAFSGLGRIIASVLSFEVIRRTILLADKMKLLDAQIRNVTKNAESFRKIRDGIRSIADETGGSIESVTKLAQALLIAGESIGATDEQTVTLADNLFKLGNIGGSSATAMRDSMRQFGQAMAGGIVRAEEFNSIVENTPLIAKAMADGMDTTIGALRKMVIEGKLLSEETFEALLRQTGQIRKDFEAMPETIDRASGKIKNAFAAAVQEIDNGLGVTESIANMMVKIAELIKSDLVPAADELALGFEEMALIWKGTPTSLGKAVDETLNWAAAMFALKESFKFIIGAIRNFPANIRDITTVFVGEFNKMFIKAKATIDKIAIFFAAGMDGVFTEIESQWFKLMSTMSQSISNLFSIGFEDSILGQLFGDFAKQDAELSNNLKKEAQKRQASIDSEIDAIDRKAKAAIAAADANITSGLFETQNMKKEVEKRIELLRQEIAARREAAESSSKEAEDDDTRAISGEFISADEALQKQIDKLNELVETFGLTKQALNLYNAEKLIAAELDKAGLKASEDEINALKTKGAKLINITKILNKKLDALDEEKLRRKREREERQAQFEEAIRLRQTQGFISDLGSIFGANKEAAIANATLSLGTAIAKAWEKGIPLAFADIAAITSGFANVFGTIRSARGPGRQMGGTVSSTLATPINEGGAPEIFTDSANRQFLLPDRGGRVDPLSQGGGFGGLKIIVNNNAPEVEVTQTMTNDEIIFRIDRAEENAVKTVNSSLASGRGDSFESLRKGANISRALT